MGTGRREECDAALESDDIDHGQLKPDVLLLVRYGRTPQEPLVNAGRYLGLTEF